MTDKKCQRTIYWASYFTVTNRQQNVSAWYLTSHHRTHHKIIREDLSNAAQIYVKSRLSPLPSPYDSIQNACRSNKSYYVLYIQSFTTHLYCQWVIKSTLFIKHKFMLPTITKTRSRPPTAPNPLRVPCLLYSCSISLRTIWWWPIPKTEICSCCTQCSGLSLIDNIVVLWL
jgi:hypothetical protein